MKTWLKRSLAVVMVICVCLTLTIVASAAAITVPVYSKGDVNGDGTINSSDALLVLKHAVHMEVLQGQAFDAADLDDNGLVKSIDALEILKIVVQIKPVPTTPPTEPPADPVIPMVDTLFDAQGAEAAVPEDVAELFTARGFNNMFGPSQTLEADGKIKAVNYMVQDKIGEGTLGRFHDDTQGLSFYAALPSDAIYKADSKFVVIFIDAQTGAEYRTQPYVFEQNDFGKLIAFNYKWSDFHLYADKSYDMNSPLDASMVDGSVANGLTDRLKFSKFLYMTVSEMAEVGSGKGGFTLGDIYEYGELPSRGNGNGGSSIPDNIITQNINQKTLGAKLTSPFTEREYALSFVEDFGGTAINTSIWTVDTYSSNDEWQAYTEDNVNVRNGNLVLTAEKRAQQIRQNFKNGNRPLTYYASGKVTSYQKQSFQYGMIECYAKSPKGLGMWPAFWTMGISEGWAKCGEIDIFEMVGGAGRDAEHSFALHWKDKNGGTAYVSTESDPIYHLTSEINRTTDYKPLANAYHIYGVEWTEKEMVAYMDGVPYFSVPISADSSVAWPKSGVSQDDVNKMIRAMSFPFHQKHYMIANFAVGGAWATATFDNTDPHLKEAEVDANLPQDYQIDWIKVWQVQ